LSATVEAVYQRFFPVIREKCRSMLRDADDAQDVAQETFIRLWRAGLNLEDPRRVASWVYRTATHLAVDRLRRNARGAEVRGVEADAAVSSDSRLETRQLLERLAGRIPADELELAFLDRVDGLTQPESAEVLGVSERTVRRMLVRLDERIEALRIEALGNEVVK
jgi:RNA polymerase sigma-70 factor (ECF subfamily)